MEKRGTDLNVRFVLILIAGIAAAQTPTFTKDVAPILYKNCVICHRAGDIAPMSLMSYKEARPWAKSIRAQIATGKMPPWHLIEPRGTFSNDRRLTDREKETLVAWVDHAAPKGNPKDLPPAPMFAAGWEIGKPDVVLSMEKPYSVPESGTIRYRFVQIPTNFTEDKWIQAIEVRPGARSVVHHILVFCHEPEGTQALSPFVSIVPKVPAAGSNGDKRGP